MCAPGFVCLPEACGCPSFHPLDRHSEGLCEAQHLTVTPGVGGAWRVWLPGMLCVGGRVVPPLSFPQVWTSHAEASRKSLADAQTDL